MAINKAQFCVASLVSSRRLFPKHSANMFGKDRYFGLKGTRLNVAIGILAGLDFLLFGYDQGVMGGLLTLPSFVRKWRRRNQLST